MARTIVVVRNNSSLFPGSWDVVPEDSGWYSLFPQGRQNPNVYVHARAMASDATRTAFVVCAPSPAMESFLSAIAAASTRAWTRAELIADNGALATGLKAIWRDMRDGNPTLLASMVGHDYSAFLDAGL